MQGTFEKSNLPAHLRHCLAEHGFSEVRRILYVICT